MASEREVDCLDLGDLIDLVPLRLGEPPPVRDFGLLGSAAARPQTMVAGVDAYGDISTKAAALLQSIVKNHALVDGNKRLGWLATACSLLSTMSTLRAHQTMRSTTSSWTLPRTPVQLTRLLPDSAGW